MVWRGAGTKGSIPAAWLESYLRPPDSSNPSVGDDRIAALTRRRQIAAHDLHEALNSVAAYRGVPLEPLAPLLEGMPSLAQPRWATWRRNQRLTDSTPEQFEELLMECTAFADPVLDDVASARWDPETREWR